MKHRELFFAAMSIFFVVPIFGMHSKFLIELPIDIYKDALVPFIDHPFTANAFFSTCTELWTIYGVKENPVNHWLLRYPEKCSSLPENSYHAALVHFSRQKNKGLVQFLITHENDIQKQERKEICTFFGYNSSPDDIKEHCKCVRLAYCGIVNDVIERSYIDRSTSVKLVVAQAMNANKRQILKIFIKNKLKLNSLFPTGKRGMKTYYSWAAGYNDLEMMELLKKVGSNINVAGKVGNTLLHVVVQSRKHLVLIKLLLDYGANANQKNNFKHTPFDYAASDKIRSLLIKYGADVPWYSRASCFFS